MRSHSLERCEYNSSGVRGFARGCGGEFGGGLKSLSRVRRSLFWLAVGVLGLYGMGAVVSCRKRYGGSAGRRLGENVCGRWKMKAGLAGSVGELLFCCCCFCCCCCCSCNCNCCCCELWACSSALAAPFPRVLEGGFRVQVWIRRVRIIFERRGWMAVSEGA